MESWILALIAVLTTLVGSADEDPRCLILGMLDVERRAAIVSYDPDRLAEVYATTNDEDRALIKEYQSRGLRLEGLALQRLSCRTVTVESKRVVLKIVDQLGPTWTTTSDGVRHELPRDRPSAHTVVLVQNSPDGRWRVRSVQP